MLPRLIVHDNHGHGSHIRSNLEAVVSYSLTKTPAGTPP